MSAHTSSPLKRFSLCLTDDQVEMLFKVSRKTGLSCSMVARKLFPSQHAIEAILKNPEKLLVESE